MLMSATKAMPTATPVKMLVGKSAIVTGSTSGIGLGIARALAASGANVLLNGFGDRREIETICADITAESGVAAHYDAADMSKPAAASTSSSTMPASSMSARSRRFRWRNGMPYWRSI